MNKSPNTDVVKRRAIDAEARASRWLADGNVADDPAIREECYRKSQFWLDRANLLRGYTDRPAPDR